MSDQPGSSWPGAALYFKANMKPEMNNRKRTHPSRRGAWVQEASRGPGQVLRVAATSCLVFVCLIHLPGQFYPRCEWEACSVTSRVFEKWVQGRASAESISPKKTAL